MPRKHEDLRIFGVPIFKLIVLETCLEFSDGIGTIWKLCACSFRFYKRFDLLWSLKSDFTNLIVHEELSKKPAESADFRFKMCSTWNYMLWSPVSVNSHEYYTYRAMISWKFEGIRVVGHDFTAIRSWKCLVSLRFPCKSYVIYIGNLTWNRPKSWVSNFG